uniref:Uncharacterized protein n=1 Tax=Panagrolaimus sp. PS1159 TaxID=55785 RepID=A0AC35FRF0_9BILA
MLQRFIKCIVKCFPNVTKLFITFENQRCPCSDLYNFLMSPLRKNIFRPLRKIKGEIQFYLQDNIAEVNNVYEDTNEFHGLEWDGTIFQLEKKIQIYKDLSLTIRIGLEDKKNYEGLFGIPDDDYY